MNPSSAATAAMPAVGFLRLYLPFAAGYLLSYLYRMVNAVISPDLSNELALSPSALGLLTGAYLVAFASLQLPIGMLLDRYGPRRVEPVLLALAATGALAFAASYGLTELVTARAMIGAGCAACLMSPLKAIATWYPQERQASLSGWIMVAGGCGALLATSPLEAALTIASWRTVFAALAAATYAVAIALWIAVPDVPKHAHGVGLGAQWRGVTTVLTHARFWWIVPVGTAGVAILFAVQGLWSVPWLMEIEGYTRAVAARHLFVMGVVMLVGYFTLGMFATQLSRRGIKARHLFAVGYALNFVALVAIVARLPASYLWWALFGFGAIVNILVFAVLNEGLSSHLAGRSNTAVNLLMIGGSFIAQWGIGVVVDAAKGALGFDTAAGLQLAFTVAIGLYLITFAWFAYGWRRHSRVHHAMA